MPDTFTTADGSKLGYRIAGDTGPFLVLCHALLATSEQWVPQLEDLSKHFRVVCPDTRGHGLSTGSTPVDTVEDLAGDILALFDHLGIDRAHLLGASMSGVVVQHFAATHPDRVEKLVLANTTWRYGPEAHASWQARIETARTKGLEPVVDSTLERFLTVDFRTAHPGRAATLRDAMLRTDVAGFVGCCNALDGADLSDLLPAIKAPTLLIAGQSDVATTPQIMEDLAARISGARLAVLPGAHLCNYETPQGFTAELLGFLA
ncbi:alpha/beta fold hydrolase [Gemmobacter sp.]|uniref:alpha/beta fold hydrolase n=1 Tax=Gemmobacter sp. TaxID=1898957 RepID=UPI002AFE8537|nr:alpha/beta fold hydrolase [Gemmobacter sp.]